MTSLPFKITGVLTDFADSEGIARLDSDGLVLEFQIKDNVLGLLKSAPREVRIPFGDLAEASFKRGFFSGAIRLRARRLTILASIPGSNASELILTCKRRDRPVAQDLASRLSMRILEHDLREMADSSRPPLPRPPGNS